MSTIKETAKAYVPQQTRNITELDKVSVNIEVKEKIVHEGTPGEFRVRYFVEAGEEYRVGKSVLKQLKQHLASGPDLAFFKVTSEGVGFNTEYTVIPLH